MITMYVMQTCPYCTYVEKQVAGNKNFRIVDIGAHVRNLKEFLKLRDTNPAFDEAKKIGDIGIPCYVREDGTVTLNSTDVGLIPMPDGTETPSVSQIINPQTSSQSADPQSVSQSINPQAPSCRIDGTGC